MGLILLKNQLYIVEDHRLEKLAAQAQAATPDTALVGYANGEDWLELEGLTLLKRASLKRWHNDPAMDSREIVKRLEAKAVWQKEE